MKRVYIIILTFLVMVLSSCRVLNHYETYEDYNLYHVISENGETYNSTLKNIEISWVKGSVNISTSNEYNGITIFEKTKEKYEKDFLCHVYRNEDFLKIKYCASDVSIPNNMSKTLEIYIPESFTLSSLEIDSVSNSTSISSITCESIEIDNVSGNVSIDKVKADSIDYSGVSGSFTSILTNSTRNLSVEQVSGTSIISLPNNSKGFTADFDSVSGTFYSAFETYKNENKYIYDSINSMYLEIEFDSVSGSLTISKHSSNDSSFDDNLNQEDSSEGLPVIEDSGSWGEIN